MRIRNLRSTKEEGRFDSTEASPWMPPFLPRRFLRNGRHSSATFRRAVISLPEPMSQIAQRTMVSWSGKSGAPE